MPLVRLFTRNPNAAAVKREREAERTWAKGALAMSVPGKGSVATRISWN